MNKSKTNVRAKFNFPCSEYVSGGSRFGDWFLIHTPNNGIVVEKDLHRLKKNGILDTEQMFENGVEEKWSF